MPASCKLTLGISALLLVLGHSARTPGSQTKRPEETCIWTPLGKSTKVYHFQVVTNSGNNMAMRFVRDPSRPLLELRMNSSWAAWMPAPWFNDDVGSSEIQFAPLDDDTRIDDTRNPTDDTCNVTGGGTYACRRIDILDQWRYVRRLRLGVGPDGVLRPNGIEFGVQNSTFNFSFAGGAYYPGDLSKRSLWNVIQQTLSAEPGPNQTMPALMHGRGSPRDDGPVPPGRNSMFGVRASELPQIPTGLRSVTSPLFSSMTSGVSVNTLDVTRTLVSFSSIGVLISGFTSLTNLDQRWSDLWNMDALGSEKLFDKLWCSGIFDRCPGVDDVIVPPGKECPVFEE